MGSLLASASESDIKSNEYTLELTSFLSVIWVFTVSVMQIESNLKYTRLNGSNLVHQ